jgi:hypothetical protein
MGSRRGQGIEIILISFERAKGSAKVNPISHH